jgi:hypothetical protein
LFCDGTNQVLAAFALLPIPYGDFVLRV